MPSSRVLATNASKSSIVPRSGCSASCPPSADPIAHGEPGSPSAGVSVLFLPLRNVVPMGCTGGRYTTSKPMPAIASSRLAAVRSVPEAGARRPIGSIWTPSERGKNSYHEPYSARSRSTWTVSGRDLVTSSRSGQLRRMAAISGSSAASSRSHGASPRSRSVATSARSAVLAAAGARARRLRDPPRGPLEQQRALGEHQLHVLASGDLDGRVVVPAGDRVAPRLHVEAPHALAGHGHVRAPPVGARRELAHVHQRARLAIRVAQHRRGVDDAVPLAEDRGTDLESLACYRPAPGGARSPPRAPRQGSGFVQSRWLRYRARLSSCQRGYRFKSRAGLK